MSEFRVSQESWEHTVRMTEEMHEALLGTLEKAGFIRETESRLASLEKFKSALCKTAIWVMNTTVGAIILTVIGGLFVCRK